MHNFEQIKKSFVLQQDAQDCGVACLASIVQFYEGCISLENLRRSSGTTIQGTTLLGLFQAAEQMGFDAEGCFADMESLLKHPDPLILHVLSEKNQQHYIVCYGKTEANEKYQFIIGDPAKGIIFLSVAEIEKIWMSKSCVILKPNDKFIKTATLKKYKKQWLKSLLKEDTSILAVAVGIGILIATLSLAMAFFSQKLIDNILPQKQYLKLNLGIFLLIVLLLIKEGFSLLRQYFLLRQSKEFNIRITNFFYSHLLFLPKHFFDTREIGDLTARLSDTARIQKVISQFAGSVIIDLLVTLSSLAFLFYYSWKIALFCLCILPFYYLFIKFKVNDISKEQLNVMIGYAKSEANYISTLRGIDVIKEINKQKLFSILNKTFYKEYQEKVFKLGKIQVKLTFLVNSFGIVFLTAILLFNSYQVLNGELKTGELVAILGMCSTLLPSIANIALLVIPFNEAKVAFNRMFEFTNIKPESNSQEISEEYNFDSLQTKGLCFRFPGKSRLLQNVQLKVSKGEIIGLMGENGSGKTTLSGILLKNYLPEQGSVIINQKINLNDLTHKSWRNIAAYIPQHIHVFNSTILENIAFDDALKDPQSVILFLNELGFTDYFKKLPQSYMTLIGENGINLSGGQKQMIALARALYRKPQLFILDEATASMDRESEQFVLKLLKKMKDKIAVIFITHRLHILKALCNRVYILENGTISANGCHNELMKTENLYSTYWQDLTNISFQE